MPTLEHNGFVDMFRENPSLAPRFVATLFHLEVPAYTSVAVVESALDQLIPVEFRADLVLELRNASGARLLAIVLEVQREKDADRKSSWLVHAAIARARRRCPTIVLVVAPRADVAAWAEEPIDVGLHRGSLSPLVLGPAVVPEVTDEALAEKEAELAILSAVMHGNGPNGLAVVQSVRKALGRFDREHAAVYFQLVRTALHEPMRRALGEPPVALQIKWKATLPTFAQQLVDRGEIAGEIKATRGTLLRLVARAGITLSEDERARVDACTDLATLERWVDNVLGAKTAADVLA
jgi:hypothetical protein